MNDAVEKLRQAASRNAEVNDHVAAVAQEQKDAADKATAEAAQKARENGNAGTG
jgi:hypothetical protein